MPDREYEKVLRESIDRDAACQRTAVISGSWWHSIDLGKGYVTPGVHSLDELRENYTNFRLPQDLSGNRVLDVGCWDGFYSFEAERHGAQVVAVDCFRPQNFFKAHCTLKSQAKFHEMSVYELNRKKLGAFEIVLFLGVLYHLRHPLLGLERICEVTRGIAIIESHIIDNLLNIPKPAMEFYELDELAGQYDNWWGPNTDCLVRMIRAAGFARVELLRKQTARVIIKAYRTWDDPPACESSPSLEIVAAFNAFTYGNSIPTSGCRAFLGLYVKGLPEDVIRESLHIHVGGYGVNPVFVGDSGYAGVKQVNAPIPPGLDAGELGVWVQAGSCRSNEAKIGCVEGTDW